MKGHDKAICNAILEAMLKYDVEVSHRNITCIAWELAERLKGPVPMSFVLKTIDSLVKVMSGSVEKEVEYDN
jgi:hypothetical protein